jgi:TolB-like protein/DNA-binding winged helix-turn-helix (wHTH) protein
MSEPDADPTAPIDLSAQPPFRLGGLEIRPSTRQVLADGKAGQTAEPRVLQVLVALACVEGAVVSRDALVARCWEGRIVGEDAIHRAIAKTRQLAELTEPPAFTIETVPRVGYRLRTGQTPADAPIPLAEADIPPAAPKAKPKASGVPRFSRRSLALGGMAAGAVGVAGEALYLVFRQGPNADPLLAVLPFDNLSPDPQLGYFADGLSEDILNTLIRGGGVRVTSRTSSFTFRGAAKAKAAKALKADYLLDGSVLREGGRLRVNVQLTDVAARQTLWSQSYDRDVDQGLQIEDEVAGRVAHSLKVRFEARPGARRIDPVAFDLYLRGREATGQHNSDSLREGREFLRRAVAIAPDFAPAWFELARNCWRSGYLSPLAEQAREYELGLHAAERAVKLDPRNGAAIGVMAEMSPTYRHWREIDARLVKGLELSPSDPNLLVWRANFLHATGHIRAAVDFARRAVALDPFDIFPNMKLSSLLTFAEQYAEAQALLDRMREVFPKELATFWNRFYLLLTMRRDAEALVLLKDPNRPFDPGLEYAVLTQTVKALAAGGGAVRAEAAKATLQLAGQGLGYATNALLSLNRLGAFDEAVALARSIYLGAGDIPINRTIAFLENSRYPAHGEADVDVLFHPLLRPLRQSGRLNPIFDGLGLSDLWRSTGPPDS